MRTIRTLTAAALATGIVTGALGASAPADAAVTTVPATGRVSVSTNGLELGQGSQLGQRAFIDGTGRYVFFSTANDLLDDSLGLPDHDTNGERDVYRRDRLTGVTERVAFAGDHNQISGPNIICGLSSNGRYLGFAAKAPNLPSGSLWRIYLRDLETRTNTLVTVSSGGLAATAAVDEACPVSDDGKTVAFASVSDKLIAGDTNGSLDVYVRKLATKTTFRASLNAAGNQIDGFSYLPALSGDGNVVGFQTASPGVVPGDNSLGNDVYVRKGTTTTLVSVPAGGGDANGSSSGASISTTGRYVAFESTASNLAPGDGNGANTDVFRKDLQTGAVAIASVNTAGQTGSNFAEGSTITGDGRFVGFTSTSNELYSVDLASHSNAFRHDFVSGRTDLFSRAADTSAPGNSSTRLPDLSDDGRVGAFMSYGSNLVTGDLNGIEDVFVRDFALDIMPFSTPKKLVAQQYVDFLGLSVDALGPDAGKLVTNGLSSPDHYIVTAAHGEWSLKRAPLIRLYWSFFLRTPDQNGMEYWTKKLNGGTKLSAIATQFAKSSEFQTKYGSLSNPDFVTKIYQNIFDRNPDPEGLAYWTKKLDTKAKTRGDVMVSFSESSEGKRVLAPQVDTVLIHLGMLRTMPSKATFDAAVAAQQAGGAPEQFAGQLRHTAAYAARAVK